MSNLRTGFRTIGLIILLMGITSFVTWATTSAETKKTLLKDTLVKPAEIWLVRHGDGIDSRQAFSIASIINDLQNRMTDTQIKDLVTAETQKAMK